MKKNNLNIIGVRSYMGLTLIEMIITISIIATMAAIVVISMNPARQAAKLEGAQAEFASEIKLAKAYALQGKMQGTSTPCGYGVYTPTTSNYAIFYNLPATGETCEQSNALPARRMHMAGSGVLPAKTLPDGITVANEMLYFTVPNANVFDISGNTFEGIIATFTLTNLSGATAEISVNNAGQISSPEQGT